MNNSILNPGKILYISLLDLRQSKRTYAMKTTTRAQHVSTDGGVRTTPLMMCVLLRRTGDCTVRSLICNVDLESQPAICCSEEHWLTSR